ncbi:MAG: hypothetical protein KJP25_00220 [Gammaproteobacteria bacterium]|nr:hypothetical protein [Gammaproteobacteria bacterium]NND38633.1 hypothetical protein [Pseudomonadales bacterium]NNM11712.1 hypothetical protein [Pseudomonadales bacterium]RZV53127.1 MAG: hypothetical protein EX270_09015 [Pseudomonadales bacterium]
MYEAPSDDQSGQVSDTTLPRQDTTPVAIPPDNPEDSASVIASQENYTMTVTEAHAVFTKVGLPISERTVSRYCARGRIDCLKIDPESGEITDGKHFSYVINPGSLNKQFERMREKRDLEKRRADRSSHDLPIVSASRDVSSDDMTSQNTSESPDALNADSIEMIRPDTVKPLSNNVTSEKGVWVTKVEKLRKEIELLRANESKLIRDKEIAEGIRHNVEEMARKNDGEWRANLKEVTSALTASQHKLGGAEAQLRALQPPKGNGSKNFSADPTSNQ